MEAANSGAWEEQRAFPQAFVEVPTAPPQNVQVEAVNSTTIQFLWNPPPQQFINGINQGYKLLAWPVDAPETVTVVTIAPDFHGVHSGYITNLKKYTTYYTSVLCFTTPGDGPRSTPQLLRTLEDKPGAVGHLSFTEILDTSLKVSWQEPVEKNGIITGYQISWEVYGRNESRLARTLTNATLEYKITGLSSLTTYTIEVAAVTAKGSGWVTSSTISSGVPPELPGAPSNLVISNISPRSATLQFRPGYDGKTSICKWIVEGQLLPAPFLVQPYPELLQDSIQPRTNEFQTVRLHSGSVCDQKSIAGGEEMRTWVVGAEMRAGMPPSWLGSKLPWTYHLDFMGFYVLPFRETQVFTKQLPVKPRCSLTPLTHICSKQRYICAVMQTTVASSEF